MPFTLTTSAVQSMLGGPKKEGEEVGSKGGPVDKDMAAMKKALASPGKRPSAPSALAAGKSPGKPKSPTRRSTFLGALAQNISGVVTGGGSHTATTTTTTASSNSPTTSRTPKRPSYESANKNISRSQAPSGTASSVPHIKDDLDSSDEEDEDNNNSNPQKQSIEELIAQATKSPAATGPTMNKGRRASSVLPARSTIGTGKRYGSTGDVVATRETTAAESAEDPGPDQNIHIDSVQDGASESMESMISRRLARGLARQQSVPSLDADLDYHDAAPSTMAPKNSSRPIQRDDGDDSDSSEDEGGYVHKIAPRRYSSGGKAEVQSRRHNSVEEPYVSPAHLGPDEDTYPPGSHGNGHTAVNPNIRRRMMMGRRGMMQRSRSVNNVVLQQQAQQQQELSSSLHGRNPQKSSHASPRRSSLGDMNGLDDSDSEDESSSKKNVNDQLLLKRKNSATGRRRGSVERANHQRRASLERPTDDNVPSSGTEPQHSATTSHRRRTSTERRKETSSGNQKMKRNMSGEAQKQHQQQPHKMDPPKPQLPKRASSGGQHSRKITKDSKARESLSQSMHRSKSPGRKSLNRTKSLDMPESVKGKLDKKLSRRAIARKKSLNDSYRSGSSSSSGNTRGSGGSGSDGSAKLERLLNKKHPNKRRSFHDSLVSSKSAGSESSGGTATSAPVGLSKTRSFDKHRKDASSSSDYNAALNAYGRSPPRGDSSGESDENDSSGSDDERERRGELSYIQSTLGSAASRSFGPKPNVHDESSGLSSKSERHARTLASKGTDDAVKRALDRRDMVRSFSLRALDEPGVQGDLKTKSLSLLAPDISHEGNRSAYDATRLFDNNDAEDCLISRSFSVAPPPKKGGNDNRVRSFSVETGRKGNGRNVVRSFSMKNRMGALLLSDHSSKSYGVEDDDTTASEVQDEILSFGSDESEQTSDNEFDSEEEYEDGRDGKTVAMDSGDTSTDRKKKESTKQVGQSKKKTREAPIRNEEDKFDWKGKAREDKLKRKISKKKKKKQLSDANEDDALNSLDEREGSQSTLPRKKLPRRCFSTDGDISGSSQRAKKTQSLRRNATSDEGTMTQKLRKKETKTRSLPRSKSVGGAVAKTPLKPRSSSVKRTSSGIKAKEQARSSSVKRTKSVKKFPAEGSSRGSSKSRKKKSFGNTDPELLELLHAIEDNSKDVCKLLQQKPVLAERKDATTGMLALHYATRHDSSLKVIEELIAAYPHACETVCEKNGFTPLHYALDADIETAKIKALIKACPRALKITDRRGQIPLHVAVSQNASLASIRLLVFIYPESIDLETAKGETPRKIAKRKKSSSDVLSALKHSKKG